MSTQNLCMNVPSNIAKRWKQPKYQQVNGYIKYSLSVWWNEVGTYCNIDEA